MANVIFGNHSSVIVPLKDRDDIRRFYCDVLGGKITKADDERDFLRLGGNFIGFLYGDVADEGEFLRTARAMWLEIKTDNVEEMTGKILQSGLVRTLEIPDPHLYFQAPGGQCWRLVGIEEDMSFYEGSGEGPNVSKVKQAIAANKNEYHKIKKAIYTLAMEVEKSPNDVFKRVVDLSKWWPEDFEGESIELNTEFVLKTGDSHYSKNKVIEFVPDKKVGWLTIESIRKTDNFDWSGTKVIVELTPKGGCTLLKFTYDGVAVENEYERLVQICDMTVKEMLYNFIVNGKEK